MTETLFSILSTSGLPLAASIFILSLIIIAGMIVYYLNRRIDNLKTDLKEDYAKKIDLMEHQKCCNKDELISNVYDRLEHYMDKLDKKIDNMTDKFYVEIKSINENITKILTNK